MASPEDNDFSGGDSLFEGMILFNPADLSPSPPPPLNPEDRHHSLPPPSSEPSHLPPPSADSVPSTPTSQPLDEDLFSDLTLQTQIPPVELLNPNPSPKPDSSPTQQPPAGVTRQISRKKKRAVRIGYARDSLPLDDFPQNLPPIQVKPVQDAVPAERPQSPSRSPSESTQEHKAEVLSVVVDDGAPETTSVEVPRQEMQQERRLFVEKDHIDSMEDKLETVRAQISSKLDEIREKAMMLSSGRKVFGRKRRNAMEDVNVASEKYKELERELEEACEAEDFEKADRLSESLAEKEKEKDRLVSELRETEMECDALDLKMQEVLELQIAAEEEGITLLQQFAQDATDNAELVVRRAEEISSKELEEWESSMENLEIKRMEMSIESQLVAETRSGLEKSVEYLVEDDRNEVEVLRRKQGVLSKELDELLALVRLKEAEIAENDSQIYKLERKISEVISEFRGTQGDIEMKHDNLQLSLSKLESQHDALSSKKKEIDEFLLQAHQKSFRLKELASITFDEARSSRDLVSLRKSLASSVLKSREDKVKFAKTEETILEEVQTLRQQISSARITLQELSSTRVRIQQEIDSCNQRIGFIDKRGPELEAEKKIAAAARNFKEAGRIATEAKALNLEKESLESKIEKAVLDLKKLEEEIKNSVDKIQDSEGLILLKQKDAAMAGCRRLRLVAAYSRAERSAALEMSDEEEANSLLIEAEAAESKARELQETYHLVPEDDGKSLEHSVSIASITSLSGKHLAELAASLNLPTNGESHDINGNL